MEFELHSEISPTLFIDYCKDLEKSVQDLANAIEIRRIYKEKRHLKKD